MRCGLSLSVVAIAGMLLAGCATLAQQPSTKPSAARTTVAVVGDSLSAGSPLLASGEIDPDTWVAQLPSAAIVLKGGWAVAGATSTAMRAGASHVDADVLVIMAGTNDVRSGLPLSETEANLIAIRRIVGGGSVLVTAIPPDDAFQTQTASFNLSLQSFVRSHGWSWVDPWGPVRVGQRYRPGMSDDGVHPVRAAAAQVAVAMVRSIKRLGASG